MVFVLFFVIQPEYVHSNMFSFCIYLTDSIILNTEEAQSSSHQDHIFKISNKNCFWTWLGKKVHELLFNSGFGEFQALI